MFVRDDIAGVWQLAVRFGTVNEIVKIARLTLPLLLVGCIAAPPIVATEVPPPPRVPFLDDQHAPPTWTYWKAIDLPLSNKLQKLALPLDLAPDEVRFGDPTTTPEQWATPPAALQQLVASQGFGGQADGAKYRAFSSLYGDLRAYRIPALVTFDALSFVTHLAFAEALRDVEERVAAPALVSLLTRVDERLGTDSKNARPDLRDAFDVARGTVEVALALLGMNVATVVEPPGPRASRSPAAAPTRPTLASRVEADVQLARSGRVEATSALLETRLDFSSIGAIKGQGRRADRARALAWLTLADLVLTGRTERGATRADVDIAVARLHARAALLLAHAVSARADAEAATALWNVERIADFVSGEPEDSDMEKVESSARTIGESLGAVEWMANVVSIDRIRHELARGTGRFAGTAHLLGRRETPDVMVLRELSAGLSAGPSAVRGGRKNESREGGARACRPLTLLDVATWLGSAEARDVLAEAEGDRFAGYESRLEQLYRVRPVNTVSARHASVEMSWIDTLATYLAPSVADAALVGAETAAFRRRKLEAAFSAWTHVYSDTMLSPHDAEESIAHDAVTIAAPLPAEEGNPVAAFVEPHPEAIARLLAFERQFAHGFEVFGALSRTTRASRLISAVDDLLSNLLDVAVHEANDEPLSETDRDVLEHLPERFLEIEALSPLSPNIDTRVNAGGTGAADTVESVRGPFPMMFAVREIETHRVVVSIGGVLAHGEQPLEGDAVPTFRRDGFASSYTAPGAEPAR